MASTEQILKAARDLGELVSTHEATRKLTDALKQLEKDRDAQRLLTDHRRHMSTIAQKEQEGKPIEVSDKHKLEDLQSKVIQHPLLRDLQIIQMDYLDLMRQVDEAISGLPKETEAPAVSSPVVNPDVTGAGA